MGEGDGDKSCDRNDSAKLLLARIRARNCPSLVVRLVRCRSRPRAAGRRGRGASSTQILRAHPHSPQEEAMSVTRAQPRTRPSGHWSIDFARGGLLRGDYASPSCRFPEEGRVHAEAEPEAGGRGGASAATIGARDRDAVASRGDHATGRGDRESAASAPSHLASLRSLSSSPRSRSPPDR